MLIIYANEYYLVQDIWYEKYLDRFHAPEDRIENSLQEDVVP